LGGDFWLNWEGQRKIKNQNVKSKMTDKSVKMVRGADEPDDTSIIHFGSS
jgi:hypothetical protein